MKIPLSLCARFRNEFYCALIRPDPVIRLRVVTNAIVDGSANAILDSLQYNPDFQEDFTDFICDKDSPNTVMPVLEALDKKFSHADWHRFLAIKVDGKIMLRHLLSHKKEKEIFDFLKENLRGPSVKTIIDLSRQETPSLPPAPQIKISYTRPVSTP